MKLIYLTLGWVSGIVLVANASPQPSALWIGLTLGAALALWLMYPTRWRWAFVALLALMAGGLRASYLPQTSPVASFNNTGGLTIIGQVTDEPSSRDTITLARVHVHTVEQAGQRITTRGQVLVRAPTTAKIAYGDSVRVTGRLASPGVYDTFSYADYLARQGVFSVMYNAAVEITATGGGTPVYQAILRAKSWARGAIQQAMPEPQAGLLVGILLGDETDLSPQLKTDFAATGAAHIIAISGFNMVILASIITGTLGYTRRGTVIALALITVYTVLVGAGAAVVRAALMSSVLIIGRTLKRQTYVPASLAFVALLMSAINPRVLWSVSFQLSFFATLGLALFATPAAHAFERNARQLLPRPLADPVTALLTEPLIVTGAALVTTLPLTMLYFNQVSLVQVLVNVLIVPIQALILIWGMLATLLSGLIPPVAQVLYWLTMGLLSWTVAVVRGFAGLPFAQVTFFVDPALVQAFFGILIGGAMLHATQPEWARRFSRWARSRVVLGTVSVIGAVMFGLGAAVYASRPDGQLHVHMLDVGHSNGFLIETPGGAQILVDGGRFPSRLLTHIGDRIPFNDRHLEMIVITQPDERFYGALPAVLSRYSAGVILTNGQPNVGQAFEDLQTTMAAYPVQPVVAGYRAELSDGTRLEVLAPSSVPTLQDNLDDHTLVLRVQYGDVSFLLTSDLSPAGQAALLAAPQHPLASVLQVPGHAGPRALNPDFLTATQPQVYLFHIDEANRQGHPDPDTLALLDERLPRYRTDQHGSVHVTTDGTRLWVQLRG